MMIQLAEVGGDLVFLTKIGTYPVCPACQHLMTEPVGVDHECPTPAYEIARDRLFEACYDVTEQDELEYSL